MKKVAIIGSGIAGLTLASLFQTNSNFEFIVYEKGEVLNLDEGFGIQLSVNGIFILNKLGFNHLNKNEKKEPPTFLYAMDMGNGMLRPEFYHRAISLEESAKG